MASERFRWTNYTLQRRSANWFLQGWLLQHRQRRPRFAHCVCQCNWWVSAIFCNSG